MCGIWVLLHECDGFEQSYFLGIGQQNDHGLEDRRNRSAVIAGPEAERHRIAVCRQYHRPGGRG